MRRSLLGALLITGCFSPKGSDSGGPTTTGATTTTSGPTTSDSGTNPTTGVSATTTTSTTATATTAVTSTGVMTTATTTVMTDTTAVSSTDSTTGTASTDDSTTANKCNPPCGPCFTCQEQECVQAQAPAPCDPPPGACAGLLWGEKEGACYLAIASDGICNEEGVCEPVCNLQGDSIFECIDPGCLLMDHPCYFGEPAAGVTLLNFCGSGGVMTPGCGKVCDADAGVVEGYGCQAGGDCVLKDMTDCGNYTCDAQTQMCKVFCNGPQDCAPMHACTMGMCV